MRIPAAAIVIQALLERNVTMATLWTSLGIIVISLIITIAINMKATMLQTRAGYRACANKRIEIAEHLRYLPMGWFNDNSLGEVTSVTTNTMENMANVATRVVMVTTRGFLTSGIIAAMMFLFDWRMGLACLIPMIIGLVCLMSMMTGTGMKFFEEYQRAGERISAEATEYVRGIPVVKVFQQTVYSFKSFHAAILSYRDLASGYAMMCRMKPKVFVCDEPTANLDAAGTRQLAQTLRQLKEQGFTLLIAEHRIDWLMGIADRFLYLRDGRIAAEYTPEDLLLLPEADILGMGLRSSHEGKCLPAPSVLDESPAVLKLSLIHI